MCANEMHFMQKFFIPQQPQAIICAKPDPLLIRYS